VAVCSSVSCLMAMAGFVTRDSANDGLSSPSG
jgi:hypothetical protein